MIHSVTYRHDDASVLSNRKVLSSLAHLKKYLDPINRVKIVFYKDNHHLHHEALITCHLSLFAPNYGPVEIYASQQSEIEAFQMAINKAKKKLKRLISRSRTFSHQKLVFDELEDIA